MAIKDARGNLHSEDTGRFIEKSDAERTEAAKAAYDSGVTSPYLSMEHLRQLVEHSGVPDEMLHHLIRQGFVNLTIKQGLQDKHIEGTKNYRQEIAAGRHPSILTADPVELLYRTVYRGKLILRKGAWDQREYIKDTVPIGFCVDQFSGERFSTDSGTVHFSVDGVHIVPRERGIVMKNNSEELMQYDGKHVRIIDDENETYEGIADVYFDEDGTDEYQLLLPHREYKNCLEEFSVERIKSIKILPD